MYKHIRSRIQLWMRYYRLPVRSCAVFAVCVLLSALAYSRLVGTVAFTAISSFTATITAFLLNLLRNHVQVSGITVWSSDFSVDVGAACTGIVPIMLFICAVLAYPSSIRSKVSGIVLGVFGIYTLNLVRTVSLFYIGSDFYSFFDTAHLLLWQPLIILAAMILWLFWVRRTGYVQAQ